MSKNNDILDEYTFINKFLDGEIVWKGKPNLRDTFVFKELPINFVYFLLVGLFVFVLLIYGKSDDDDVIAFVILMGLFLISVLIFQSYSIIEKVYRLIILKNSTYIITTSHLYHVNKNDKIIFAEPLNIIYQIVPIKVREDKGGIQLKIKLDRIPSKTKKIRLKKKMTYPSRTIEGIDNYLSVSKILLKTRNNAMNRKN